MKSILQVVSLFILGYLSLNAQVNNLELGTDFSKNKFYSSGYFNFSDPESINISVSVWGWVKYPGKYKVPYYTTLTDLFSYSGGPTENADLEDLRVYRIKSDSTQLLIIVNYNDILYEANLESRYRKIPKLEAGDILIVTGKPRLYFKDYFSIWMSIFSILISLSILVINIIRY